MARRGSRTYLKYLVALSTAGFAPMIAAGPAVASPVGSDVKNVSATAISAITQGSSVLGVCDWGEWGQSWGEWSQSWGEWSECGPIETGIPVDQSPDDVTKTPIESLATILRES